jgi:alpha-ketoglutarate-dependent taurine dioxygenase
MTTQASDAQLRHHDLAPRIGTAIEADVETLLSGVLSQDIRALLEQRGVVVFPRIDLTDEQQVAFTSTLGRIVDEGVGGIYKVTMDPLENAAAAYLKGAFFWHIDGTMSEMPILASIMSARALAPTGGDTEFCNTYAAFEELNEETRREIEGLNVVHAMWRSQLYWRPEPSYAELKGWMSRGTNTLPLVWKHRSGRKSLVLGATALQVEGMGIEESEKLLVKLRDWATKPQFVYRHKWSLGDMVIWDNTGTMHRAMAYDHESGRLMMRTKLEGEEAFG